MEDKRKLRLLAAVVMTVLLVDQSVKFWIKTNMSIGEEMYPLGVKWAVIHFVENPGMAFGLTFGGEYGKLALSLFRIVAVVWFLFALAVSRARGGHNAGGLWPHSGGRAGQYHRQRFLRPDFFGIHLS
ncbi:MAG TPA: signal peptidase II [Saprospiraceae bacterium]|nr:signal peptidase II [Saprospiraceae bacterium]